MESPYRWKSRDSAGSVQLDFDLSPTLSINHNRRHENPFALQIEA